MAGHRRSDEEHEQQVDRRLAGLLAAAPRRARPTGAAYPSADPARWRFGDDIAADVPGPVGADHGVDLDADMEDAGSGSVATDGSGMRADADPANRGGAGDDSSDWDTWAELLPRRGARPNPRPGRGLPDGRRRPEEREGVLRQLIGAVGRRFERPQAAVVTAIVLVGLLLAGWAVLRARPVAIASPAAIRSQGAPASDAPIPTTATSPAETAGPPAGPLNSPPTDPAAAPGPDAATSGSSPPGGSSPGATIEVHVLGAVRRPGVVRLSPGARVNDAVRAAGGLKASAHLGDLNLAQPLGDGQQVFIARGSGRSEVRDPTAPGVVPPADSSAGNGDTGTAGGSAGPPQGPVNLNTATLDQLDELPGIGPVTAQKILDWRQQNGRFSSVEELQEVDGIGPKTFADLQPLVTI